MWPDHVSQPDAKGVCAIIVETMKKAEYEERDLVGVFMERPSPVDVADYYKVIKQVVQSVTASVVSLQSIAHRFE